MATVEAFMPRVLGPKSWGEELLVAHTPHYIGKVLSMRAGSTGPLQYHEVKDETFFLFAGRAEVTRERNGHLHTVLMFPGQSYHVPPGAVHRVRAIGDCIFFEVSTPVFDDRVNVEHLYP